MANYSMIDTAFLRRYFDLLGKHGRSVDKKYGGKCGKEIFVRRTMRKWLKGKKFTVIKNEKTGLWKCGDAKDPSSCSEVTLPKKHYININGCEYTLGYSEKITIYVDDPFSTEVFNAVEFSYNDFLRLQWREITDDEFEYVSSLFDDDREETEYKITAYTKTYTKTGRMRKPQEIQLSIMAKDYRSAREKAVEQYPQHVIYG